MPFPSAVSLSLPGAAFQFSANPTDQQLPEDLPGDRRRTHSTLQTELLYWSQLCLSTMSVFPIYLTGLTPDYPLFNPPNDTLS